MLRTTKIPHGNRTNLEIIAQILRELRVPTGKTNIMSHCNMSFTQSGQYLMFMGLNDLIHTKSTDGKVTYHKTETGQEFLELYDEMALLLHPTSSAPYVV